MINFNGEIISRNNLIFNKDNRAFKYGDGVFETLKIQNHKIVFFEDHYFRLMASMRMLRMDIPDEFTLEFLENEILKTTKSNNLDKKSRVRITVFRKDGGYYDPISNKIDFVIEVNELIVKIKQSYSVELFKDFYVYSGLLSTIKTTNRMLNVLASIFASENDYDTCILVNENKQLVEVTHGNIFLVFGKTIITPPLIEGCIKGIIRKKIIEILKKTSEFKIEECAISPFELQKADEFFITNSIINIQSVTKYRKKNYRTKIGNQILELLIEKERE